MNSVLKRHCFAQNTLFYLNKNDDKMCWFPNQSSMFDLFSQVLNYNFHFKNQFNCIPTKFRRLPWCWPPFHFSSWSQIYKIWPSIDQ
jgi:hypothetical protein